MRISNDRVFLSHFLCIAFFLGFAVLLVCHMNRATMLLIPYDIIFSLT